MVVQLLCKLVTFKAVFTASKSKSCDFQWETTLDLEGGVVVQGR